MAEPQGVYVAGSGTDGKSKIGGWPTFDFFMLAPPQLRLPHPSRFSKGAHSSAVARDEFSTAAHRLIVTCDLALTFCSFHNCPRKGSTISMQHSKGVGRDIDHNSFVFWILTYKIFVMKILRGINRVSGGKLLIPDILINRGGSGPGN